MEKVSQRFFSLPCRYALFWYLSIEVEFMWQTFHKKCFPRDSSFFLKFNEDLFKKYVLITSIWFIFRSQPGCESQHRHDHITEHPRSIKRKNFFRKTFMLSVSQLVRRFHTNGIPKVEHVIHKIVDKSESVDFGGDVNCTKPC